MHLADITLFRLLIFYSALPLVVNLLHIIYHDIITSKSPTRPGFWILKSEAIIISIVLSMAASLITCIVLEAITGGKISVI